MKKILSLVVLFVCSLFVFVGCGYTGGTDVKGIAFTSSVYYVDTNVPFQLEYKVYPKTANTKDEYIIFKPLNNDNLGKYSFDARTGLIVVTEKSYLEYNGGVQDKNNPGFLPMQIRVECGELSDTCMVYVKQYPQNIHFESVETSISAGATTELLIFDQTGGRVDTTQYNFKITSSDPTVIAVDDPSRPLVRSTGKRGSATISCEIFNSANQKVSGLESSIKVNVVNNVKSAVINIENNFVRDFSAVLNFEDLQNESYAITPTFVDEQGFVVDDKNYSIVSLDRDVIDVIDDNGEYKLVLVGSGSAKVVVSSSVFVESGNPLNITLDCNVNIVSPKIAFTHENAEKNKNIEDLSALVKFSGTENENYGASVSFVDASGELVKLDSNCVIESLDESIIKVETVGGVSRLVLVGSGSTKIVITSNAMDLDGAPYSVTLNCEVSVST